MRYINILYIWNSNFLFKFYFNEKFIPKMLNTWKIKNIVFPFSSHIHTLRIYFRLSSSSHFDPF